MSLHLAIDLSNGARLHVENGAGPLNDVDPNEDPAAAAQAIWAAIEGHDPIWVSGSTAPGQGRFGPRVWYPNRDHVVTIVEIEREG